MKTVVRKSYFTVGLTDSLLVSVCSKNMLVAGASVKVQVWNFITFKDFKWLTKYIVSF